jgi:hypothetical protein
MTAILHHENLELFIENLEVPFLVAENEGFEQITFSFQFTYSSFALWLYVFLQAECSTVSKPLS